METLIRVLIWSDLLSFYAIWVLMTYLTEVWELSITHAAGILNIWGGIILLLPIAFAYLVDTILGCTKMLAISSILYSIGLAFLAMSTPPVMYKITGTCKEYESDCIGKAQKDFFYMALAFIAIGMAGHIVSLRPVLELNRNPVRDQANRRRRVRKREMLIALVTVVAGIVLPYIKPWSSKFGIPAICTLVATLIFLSGWFTYRETELRSSPITNIFRVIVASIRKISHQHPGLDSLHKGEDRDIPTLEPTTGLSGLEKAAIKLEREESKWELCTVTEVEETKIAIRMIPMWMTLAICGLVGSSGSTYFQEQANNLDRKVGKIKVPLPIFLLIQQLSKSQFTKAYAYVKRFFGVMGIQQYSSPIGIAFAMIFATLSCITAAKVEARRLGVIKTHDLLDQPDETIPMTIFWVLPQFALLGGLEAFFDSGVKDFFEEETPTSMGDYLDYLTHGVSGLGYMCSVLSVFVIGKISEKGGRQNWFQYTLNKSRLDNYYWTLAALCSVNLLIYIVVAYFYPYRRHNERQPDEEVDRISQS